MSLKLNAAPGKKPYEDEDVRRSGAAESGGMQFSRLLGKCCWSCCAEIEVFVLSPLEQLQRNIVFDFSLATLTHFVFVYVCVPYFCGLLCARMALCVRLPTCKVYWYCCVLLVATTKDDINELAKACSWPCCAVALVAAVCWRCCQGNTRKDMAATLHYKHVLCYCIYPPYCCSLFQLLVCVCE